MYIQTQDDLELFLSIKHIHLTILTFGSTWPYYEKVTKQYFNLLNFLINQQHLKLRGLFKAITEHFQIIHDLNKLKHFHLIHIKPLEFRLRKV